MTPETEKFISSFNSLTGITIGERRKNMFLLLNEIRSTSSSDCIDLSHLHPKTPLEETFKVEALIYFQKVPELMDVLKSENPILIKKILKVSSWFLEEAFKTISGEELVTLIFPFISFNVKVKIINKLAENLNDAAKADSFFEAIRAKYGSYLAFKLLPCCSADLLLNVVTDSKVKLSSRQLFIIVRKYPELSKDIFKVLETFSNFDCIRGLNSRIYKGVFPYLARTNSPLFLFLYNEYNPCFRLGWRSTHKFIQTNKEILIKSPEALCNFLHKKQITKSLKNGFVELYKNCFPKSIALFNSSFSAIYPFIRHLPSNEMKVALLEEAFRKQYGSELLQHSNCINMLLLSLLPLDKLRSITMRPTCVSEERWPAYWEVERSIPHFKKRISLSSDIKTREALVVLLVETCHINKDRKSLVGVCKYFVNQHRNDHVTVRQAFLSCIHKYFLSDQLDEETWGYINELLKIFEMNNENYNHSHDFLIAYIYYCLLNGFPIDDFLKEHLIISTRRSLFKNHPVFEKHCLLLTGKLLPDLFVGNTLSIRHIDFLCMLVDWNKRHPADQILLFDYPAAMTSFKEVAHGNTLAAQEVIEYILKSKIEGGEDELCRICLTKLLDMRSIKRAILNWLLYNKPLIVLKNIDIVACLLSKTRNRFFWRQCKNFTHLEINPILEKHCLDTFLIESNRRDGDATKYNVVMGLSYLLNTGFIKFASGYYPKVKRADAMNVEDKKLFKIQRTIADNLKNVIPPSLVLESIVDFCKGDYLKLIQSSLYSVAGNVNENNLPPFFGKLAERAVSVRKHTFHLTLRVLDRPRILDVCKHFMEKDKNSSIRKFLLKGCFNLFVQDPSDYLWDLVVSNIRFVDVEDREVVQILMAVDKISPKYIVRYVLLIWDFLNLPDKVEITESEKFNLLGLLSKNVIQLLPRTFCTEIIDQYLFKSNYANHMESIYSFTCKFIIYCTCPIEQKDRMIAIFPALTNCFSHNKSRYLVDNFLRYFCKDFLNTTCSLYETFVTFNKLWNDNIQVVGAFDHYLYLQLCSIFIDSIVEKNSPRQIGAKLAKLSDFLSEVYGAVNISVFCNILRSFITHFLTYSSKENNDNNRYTLIEGMVETSTSTACLITVISLLKRNLDNTKVQLKHDKIVNYLSSLDQDVITIHLNHQLSRL